MAPDPAWHILVYGIPTLALRMERQQDSAMKIAEFLESHPAVAKVSYPGLESFEQSELAVRQLRDIDGEFAPGVMIFFELKGDASESHRSAMKVCDHLAANALSVTLAVSLGQIRTLVEHPASMTHSAIPPDAQMSAGIVPGGIRLSVGLEDWRDIVKDLEEALASVSLP